MRHLVIIIRHPCHLHGIEHLLVRVFSLTVSYVSTIEHMLLS
uniref:Chitinase homolog LP6 (lp6) protein n=1 Tax=Pinus taeda TaxID=3352 RepID=V9GZU0_PINTA|nr:hypothetical protein a1 - loblolly pine [Pinus taeda]AAA75093.1 uORFa1; Method: conceptual translation supplied by author [Pinus taeda]